MFIFKVALAFPYTSQVKVLMKIVDHCPEVLASGYKMSLHIVFGV